MLVSKRDQKILDDLGKAKSVFPDLEEVLAFYEKIFQVQFAFKYLPERQERAEYWEKREINVRDLTDGSPQISFEELGMQPTPLPTLSRVILKLLIPYTGSAYNLDTEPSPEEIIEYAREIFLGKGPLVISGASEDIVKTASGLVLAPYLQLACEGIQPRIPPDSWHREYCPVCGGKPAFAALTSDTDPRTLFCPRCFGEWSYNRIGCPFCNAKESQIYYPSDDGRYRLYVCEVCHRYLKTADSRERGPDLCLPVANLVTVSMDLAAQEKGYKFI
jgi:formate dehydrogenase maturation protein FdhE